MHLFRVFPWRDVALMFTILVVHIGMSPTTELRTLLTCWVGISVLFTHYRQSFPCFGYGEQFYFRLWLRFAELRPRLRNRVSRACLHNLRRLLGDLRDQ